MRAAGIALVAALLAGCGDQQLGDVNVTLQVRTPWVKTTGSGSNLKKTPILDFGPIPVLDTRSAPVELKRIGQGAAPVNIRSIEFENADPGVFQAFFETTYDGSDQIVELPLNLPGGSVKDKEGTLPYDHDVIRFKVKFIPQDQKDYSGARLKITYDEGNKALFAYVDIFAAGDTSGSISVEPSPLDFGRVGEMQQSVLSVQIDSVGTGPLVLREVSLQPKAGESMVPVELTFAGSTTTEGLVLPPPASIQVPVRCAPTTDTVPVVLEAVLHIESNDLARRVVDVPVICRVNRAPIAEIEDVTGNRYAPGSEVQADGTPSHDPDGDEPLEYLWSLSTPPGSQAELDDPTSATPTFSADVAGTYRMCLVVADSAGVPCVPTTGGAVASCACIDFLVESPDELTIELSWENALTDLDLHVVEDVADPPPYGSLKDCWWRNRRGFGPPESAYRGATEYCALWNTDQDGDDPTMFPDALARYGPERVLLGEGDAVPPAGSYEIGVHFSKTNGVPDDQAATRAILRVFVYGKLSAQRDLILTPRQFWRVFKIDWSPTMGGATFEYVGEVKDDWTP